MCSCVIIANGTKCSMCTQITELAPVLNCLRWDQKEKKKHVSSLSPLACLDRRPFCFLSVCVKYFFVFFLVFFHFTVSLCAWTL